MKITIGFSGATAAWIEAEAQRLNFTKTKFLSMLIEHQFMLQAMSTAPVDTLVSTPTSTSTLAAVVPLKPSMRGAKPVAKSVQPDPELPSSSNDHQRFKGVYAYGKRWAAFYWDPRQRKRFRLGVYDHPIEAAEHYDLHLTSLGQAPVNFPVATSHVQEQHQNRNLAFVEKLARNELTEADWAEWSKGAPRIDEDRPMNLPQLRVKLDPETDGVLRSVSSTSTSTPPRGPRTTYRNSDGQIVNLEVHDGDHEPPATD